MVVPCVGPVRDWAAIVPSHDEALFRLSLVAHRHRRGFPGKKGFYCPNDLDEEDDWEAERAAKVAAFEVGLREGVMIRNLSVGCASSLGVRVHNTCE